MKPRLVHVFPAFGTGGPEVRTATLINALDEFEHVIVSLNGENAGLARLQRPDQVPFRSLERCTGATKLLGIGRALSAERPDALVTYGWGGTDAIFAARAARMAPPVHIEDGFLPDEARAQKSIRLQVRRLAFRMSAALIVPSQTLHQIAIRSWRLPARSVHFFPNGIDTERFHPPSESERRVARANLRLSADALVIGTVAAQRPDKNHQRLVRALAAMRDTPDARLVIVGDGPARAATEAAAAAAGVADRVVMPGAVTDPAPLYHAFDVFALSSDTEQMPLSVLEAMASGLAVASTDVGDLRAMLPSDGGRITLLGDDEGFAGSLGALLRDATARARAGRVNRERAETEFSLSGMISRYRGVFRSHVTRPSAMTA